MRWSTVWLAAVAWLLVAVILALVVAPAIRRARIHGGNGWLGCALIGALGLAIVVAVGVVAWLVTA